MALKTAHRMIASHPVHGATSCRSRCTVPLGLLWLASTLVACHLAVDTSNLEGGCPVRLAGPAMVKVDSASGAYCIDSTEVTNAHYKAFIDAKAQVAPP